MKPSQLPWKWLLFGLLAVLTRRPFAHALADRRHVALRRLASPTTCPPGPAARSNFTGPVRVSFLPDCLVQGRLRADNASRLPLVKSITAKEAKVSLDLVELMSGRISIDALRLHEAGDHAEGRAVARHRPRQTLQGRVADLLDGAPVGVLRLREGTIDSRQRRHRGDQEYRCALRRKRRHRGDSRASAPSRFSDETVRFALDCGAPAETEDGIRVPVNFTLTSKPLAAKLTGTASFAEWLSARWRRCKPT